MNTLISHYSNKEVPFRFAGTDLSFLLSQALFSSFEIDKGSRLLLKTVNQHIDFSKIRHALDIGCGVGTLGISLQTRFPRIRMTMQDRDALAVAFSRINAERNGAEGVETVGGLAFQGLATREFDLIVANIPAKAGEPVLKDLFSTMLCRGALSALVVVRPLAAYTERTLQELAAEIRLREDGAGHTVFHFRPGGTPAPRQRADDLPPTYFRTSAHFQCGSTAYSLDTVWGLADFDTVPYQTRVVERNLKGRPPQRRVCIWNPGQGHTTTMLAALHAASDPRFGLHINLTGRDMLALQASRHNLLGRQHVELGRILHCPSPLDAAEQLKPDGAAPSPDLLIVELEHLAGVPGPREVLQAAGLLLEAGGALLITGKSAHLAHFARSPEGFRPETSKKYKGYKSVMLFRV